ncbi:hypothetical protein BH11BAC1_BH11BAC1_09350 [soil metagenome]
MKKTIFLLVVSTLVNYFSYSQSWNLLPNSPTTGFRHDDIYFINSDTGWVVNVDGYIYKTTDGGNSFATQLYQPATSFRCVGFANANKGWAGNLGPGSWDPTTDTNPLYQTTDGGNSWQVVTNITGTLPTGICGINVVNDTIVYAVGRVGGPCYIMKTIDGGISWTSVNFDPPAFYLIDCKFFSPDSGLVVGCTGTSFSNEKIAIWRTTDGGQNWQFAYHDSSSFIGHCWKVSFPSRNIGYASVETGCSCDTTPIMKTIDGGLTWQKKIWDTNFIANPSYEQGIGFVNDSVGWCGGFFIGQIKGTTDGGNTWNIVSFVENFNRFRKVNDTIAFASGNRIWKYSNQPTGIYKPTSLDGLILEQNYPNPFSNKTTIQYSLPKKGKLILKVYDFAGRPIKTLVNAEQNKGTYKVELSLPYYFDTHFFCTLYFDNYFLTKQMLMVEKE